VNSHTEKFALRCRRIVTANGIRDAAILIDGDQIRNIISPNEIPSEYKIEDAGDLVVMPGLVDSHVHINEPGRTEWEGFETITRAAAAGGITTLIDMPLNSTPVTTTTDALHKKVAAAEGKLTVDCGFYAGLVPGNTNDIEPLIRAGVLGIKGFLIHSGIDDFPNVTEKNLRAAMPIIARHDVPLLVHCELASSTLTPSLRDTPLPVGEGSGVRINPRSYAHYLASRPGAWEHDAIALMIRLAREYSCKVHIVHVSSADAIPLIRDARASGIPITAETCPHYLYFSSEEIPDGDTRFKCAPPIRERENREKLWDALHEGTLDAIVSDHSPCSPELKCLDSGDFQKAWGGIPSVQFGLSIIWSEAMRRGYSLMDVARWMSREPARLVRLARKGQIAPGFDADLVILNPERSFTVEPLMVNHRHSITPYEGRALNGIVERTILRGQTIYERERGFREPSGTILFHRRDIAI